MESVAKITGRPVQVHTELLQLHQANTSAMDGKEPMYVHPPKPGNAHHTYLDEAGFGFVAKCFQALELTYQH